MKFLITGKESADILCSILKEPMHELRSVLVLGAGITGQELVRLFLKVGLRVILLDEKKLSEEVETELREIAQSCNLHIIDSWTGSLEMLSKFQAVFGVFSPGILPSGKFIQGLKAANIPLVSEMDFAVHYLGMPKIAITGTNGKTTTATLAHHIMHEAGLSAELLGNVGTAFSSKIEVKDLSSEAMSLPSLIVAELSSYQLDSSCDFHPHIAICLNITDDHLEKHGNMDAYIAAKSKIFAKQTSSDWSIYFKDDPLCVRAVQDSKGRHLALSFDPPHDNNQSEMAYAHLLRREVRLYLDGKNHIFSLNDSKLFGRHNVVNSAAAIIATFLSGVSENFIAKGLQTFKPLAHRLEFVSENDGVIWLNDSKSTNVASVEAALIAIDENYFSDTNQRENRKIVLLCGGISKGGPWKNIRQFLGSNLRSLIFFGRDRWQIAEELVYEDIQGGVYSKPKDSLQWECASNLKYAVERAKQLACDGDIVIFSPGGSSFDEFKNFEDRGNKFKRYVCEGYPVCKNIP